MRNKVAENNCIIVGIGYRAGSGKTTAADFLVDELDNTFMCYRLALAQPIKDFLAELLAQDTSDEAFKAKDVLIGGTCKTGAQWMQIIGQGTRDLLDPAVFCVAMMNRVTAIQRSHNSARTDAFFVIIPDVRYVNEAEWIKAQGGILLEIYRPVAQDSHPSETEGALIKWDKTIYNDSTEDRFLAQLDAFVEELTAQAHGRFGSRTASESPVQ